MFDLAHELGMTVYQLQHSMPADEFISWIAWMGIRADENKEAQMKNDFHSPGRYK